MQISIYSTRYVEIGTNGSNDIPRTRVLLKNSPSADLEPAQTADVIRRRESWRILKASLSRSRALSVGNLLASVMRTESSKVLDREPPLHFSKSFCFFCRSFITCLQSWKVINTMSDQCYVLDLQFETPEWMSTMLHLWRCYCRATLVPSEAGN